MTERPAPTEPPEHLDDEARAKWTEVLPILEERGDLEQGTMDALTLYCVAWSQWREAEGKVKELGQVVRSPAGFPVENPFSVVARKAQTELRRWANELKLTPKSAGTKGRNHRGAEPPAAANPLQNLRIHTG
jgi:P27 family predicted phage terminase small subunit